MASHSYSRHLRTARITHTWLPPGRAHTGHWQEQAPARRPSFGPEAVSPIHPSHEPRQFESCHGCGLPDEAKNVQDGGVLVFHAVGDTGDIRGDDVEGAIADAMDTQISVSSDKLELRESCRLGNKDKVPRE